MCDRKPGVRCATDTNTPYRTALATYQARYPDGPAVDPLIAAQAPHAAETKAARDVDFTAKAKEAFRNEQSLGYAVGLAEHLDIPTVNVALDRHQRLIHAWVSEDPARMRDVDGERDLEPYAAALDDSHPDWSLEVVPVKEARANARTWTSTTQQWVNARRAAGHVERRDQADLDWWA